MFKSLEPSRKIQKILAIQFKYLGDAVFITPALEVIHEKYPDAEIHILLAQEVSPVLSHLPFVKKVWGLPRLRGKANLPQTLFFVKKLRSEKFDLSIDFAGNDRGAILSLLIGAKQRISAIDAKAKFLQKVAYTKTISSEQLPKTWVQRHLKMLNLLLKTPVSNHLKIKITADPALQEVARDMLHNHKIICHLGTSQPKKEWPISHWLKFYQLSKQAGYTLAFSAGTNLREQRLIQELKGHAPEIFEVRTNSLEHYLAILNEVEVVISGDTGPLHFAAALGKKVIGLFAVEDGVKNYAPIYKKNEVIIGKPCICTNEYSQFATCHSPSPCMNSISAQQVFERLKERYPLGAA